jgi:predicted nucleotidyltransferase component of viral defense system
MLIKQIENIININNTNSYKKNLIKEYLQSYILNYLYNEPKYQDLIFTGGTCLRKIYKLNRLSEDLDFDIKSEIDTQILRTEFLNYFNTKLLFKDLTVSIRQQGKQLLFKFDILQKLNLANAEESPMLYVKIDFSEGFTKNANTQNTLITDHSFSYLPTHYDLPTLMANKMVTIIDRTRLIGKNNRESIKGRDYFDLLWFLQNNIEPNQDRIKDIFNEFTTFDEFLKLIDEKVALATSKLKTDFFNDIAPFIENPTIVSRYVDSYQNNYEISKSYLI